MSPEKRASPSATNLLRFSSKEETRSLLNRRVVEAAQFSMAAIARERTDPCRRLREMLIVA